VEVVRSQHTAPRAALKRRGLMAAMATLGAAALSKVVGPATPVALANSDGQSLTIGQGNTESGSTVLVRSGSINQRALQVNNNNGPAIYGNTTGSQDPALFGDAPNGIGLQASSTFGSGVFSGSDQSVGVYGQSNRYHGVVGLGGDIGYGVLGQNTKGGIGVYGYSTTGAQGVIGYSSSGRGVEAQSGNNIALFASSPYVAAWVESPASFALYARVPGAGTAITADAPSGTAGSFNGPVSMTSNLIVGGSLTVAGNLVVNGTKSAAIPDGEGGYRLVFCVEAPESWFQDFGSARIVGGRVTVPLDPRFASAVLTDEYHVVLTDYGNQNSGLYVSQRTPTSFEVRATVDKDQVTFGYMVVAKRKDVPQGRMPRVPADRLRPTTTGPSGADRQHPAPVPPADPPAPVRRP